MKLIAAVLGLLPLILPLATPCPAETVVEVVVDPTPVESTVETFDGRWRELPVLPFDPVGGIQL